MGPTDSPEGPPAPPPRPARLPAAAWKLLLVGLAIREGFSFWTGHPYDFEVWLRTGHAVAAGADPYAFWPPIPGVSIAYLTVALPSAAYLPFWPLVTGGLYRSWELGGGGNRFLLYFLLKQPPIAGDLAVAYLLFRIAHRWTGAERTATSVLGFWSLFPYAIVISAIWGQFDALVLALVLTSLLVADPVRRNALYGVGIFVKWITAIYLPLELFANRGWRRLTFGVALAVAAGATLLPFLVFGWGFQNVTAASVSQSSGGGGGMNWVGILTSAPVEPWLTAHPALASALSYLWVPAVVLAGAAAARWFSSGRPEGALRAMIFVTGAFLLFRWGLYEQYLVTLFALLLLDVRLFHPGRRSIFGGTVVLASAFLALNNDLGIRFLAPLSPSVTQFTDALDASALYGTVRIYGMIAVAALVTISLVQLLLVYYRDERAPWPWWRFRVSPGPAVEPAPTP
jgi:hypothetical protein